MSQRQVEDSFDKIENKTGIIFLKDYYGPGLSGDTLTSLTGRG
ncbi:type VI secretion system amidase effector protein Tae4 [Aquabacterium sp. A7-Y]|nr:hypothetical protein [Aquabacterium sp. A7-Y]MCW7540465.1 type VI secretion system amidase effector protein Tae4 [Aquabacterium sp. A7-Y]